MSATNSKTKKWVGRLKNRISLRHKNKPENHQIVPVDADPPELQPTSSVTSSVQRATPLHGSGANLISNSRQEEQVIPSQITIPAPPSTDSRQVKPDSDGRDVSTKPYRPSAAEIEELLLRHGFRNTNGRPSPSTLYAALSYAAGQGNTPLITALLDKGARILPGQGDLDYYWDNFEYTPNKFSSPLHRAVERRQFHIAEYLLDYFLEGSEQARLKPEQTTSLMELRDHNGKTLLAMAAEKGELPLVVRFEQMGGHLEQIDNIGRTPLHQAARCGHGVVVSWLLAQGADVAAQDNQGRTALDRAVAGRHHDVADVLRKHIRNLPFSGQGATGVNGMVVSDQSGDAAAETKLDVAKEITETQREDIVDTVAEEKRKARQYRVEVTTVAVEQKNSGAEGWDEPMPIMRYNALLLPSQDEGAREQVVPAEVKGEQPAPTSADWDEPFQAPRYGLNTSVDKTVPKPALEASESTASDSWDEPFSAISYRLTRRNDGPVIDVTMNEETLRSDVTSRIATQQAQETRWHENSTLPNKSQITEPLAKDSSVSSGTRAKKPLRRLPADTPTSMDILRWD